MSIRVCERASAHLRISTVPLLSPISRTIKILTAAPNRLAAMSATGWRNATELANDLLTRAVSFCFTPSYRRKTHLLVVILRCIWGLVHIHQLFAILLHLLIEHCVALLPQLFFELLCLPRKVLGGDLISVI